MVVTWGEEPPPAPKDEAIVVVTMRDGSTIESPPTWPSDADALKHRLQGTETSLQYADLAEITWLPEGFEIDKVADVAVRLIER
jgi:hypothetical protein